MSCDSLRDNACLLAITLLTTSFADMTKFKSVNISTSLGLFILFNVGETRIAKFAGRKPNILIHVVGLRV